MDRESTPPGPSSPPFRARGGVRVQGRGWSRWTRLDGFNAQWPFASLVADRNFIVISSPFGTVRFSREHVFLIEPYDGWINKGVGVRFWSDDDDRVIIFLTGDAEFIIDSLRILGWDARG
jgi:hypothetical protein